MTWEEKFMALKALCPVALKIRKPGDWYVEAPGREVGGNGMLESKYGNGKTPEEAVVDDWRQIAEHLPSDRWVIVNSGLHRRKKFRWNGFMWEEVLP